MAARSINMNQLRDLILGYFKTEDPRKRISREKFFTESMRIAGGGRDMHDALAAGINAHRLVHFWCRRGDAVRLTELLNYRNVDLEFATEEGTPLCIAARHGHAEIVDLLLKAGVSRPELPATADRCPGNPWYESCSAGHSTVFHLLLVDQNIREPLPKAALDLLLDAAVRSCGGGGGGGGLMIARSLLELGASVTGRRSLVDAAFESGSGQLLAEFLGRGAECDTRAVQVDSRDRTLRAALERLIERRPARLESGGGVGDGLLVAAMSGGVQLARLAPEHIPDGDRLCELSLTDCGLAVLPAGLLHGLGRLRTLDVSGNRLVSVEDAPAGTHLSTTLTKLNLSQNQLTDLPSHLFAIDTLADLNLSGNQLGQGAWGRTGGGADWACRRALEILDVSANDLKSLPPQVNECARLMRLYARENQLKTFPCWSCPLEMLDLSSNQIASVPVGVSTLWQTCLRDLRLSNNHLSALPVPLLSLKSLSRLSLGQNMLRNLPDGHLWLCNSLFDLDLSGNCLEEQCRDVTTGLFKKSLVFDFELVIPEQLSGLHRLNLSRNRLRRVPPSVCGLRMLETLSIDGNPRIRQIPVELAKCQQLMKLVCDPGQLQEPLRQFVLNGFVNTVPLLSYLRLQLYKTTPYYHIKMVIAGNEHHDRQNFVQYLGFGIDYAVTARGLYLHDPAASPDQAAAAGYRFQPLDVAMQSCVVGAEPAQRRILRDTLRRPPAQIYHRHLTQRQMADMRRRGEVDARRAVRADLPDNVYLHAWVLQTGRSSAIDCTHEIALTKNTLYLLLWDCLDGPRALDKIKQGLLTIQARAPRSCVIAIGQNLSPGDAETVRHLVSGWQQELMRAPGYPPVVEFLTLPEHPDEGAQAALRWAVLKCARAAPVRGRPAAWLRGWPAAARISLAPDAPRGGPLRSHAARGRRRWQPLRAAHNGGGHAQAA